MCNTIFETIIQVMLPSRSANAILYFIENKGWFRPYRVPDGYSIPYPKWREQTIISIQKIEVLSAFIFDRKGRIYYEDNMVHIRGSELKPFVSKSPREHIRYICHKHRNSFVLSRYLEEFYSYQLSGYEDCKMNIRYSIPYDVWNDLFEMTLEEVDEVGKAITTGFLCVNRNGEHSTVDISL